MRVSEQARELVQECVERRILGKTLEDPIANEVLLPAAMTRWDWPMCLEDASYIRKYARLWLEHGR